MPHFEEKNRNVVPRWRLLTRAIENSELDPLKPAEASKAPLTPLIVDKVDEWIHSRSLITASELLSTSIVLNRREEAVEAAEFINQLPSTSIETLKELANKILQNSNKDQPMQTDMEFVHRQLAKRNRNIVKRHIYDAYAWSDLAFSYASLGSIDKGMRAMKVALHLAPDDRFILRCASRMLLHSGKNDEAHRLLKRADRLKSDPWIMAAEIAVASANGIQSRYLKHAAEMIAAQKFCDLHLSELCSALGTIEVESGTKKARKLLRTSLNKPTENAIAQASWISRNFNLDIDMVRMEQLTAELPSAEALAHENYSKGNSETSIRWTTEWWNDQPFSTRPPILLSFISSLTKDFKTCEKVSRVGLEANPNDYILLNNRSFALANLGDVAGAKNTFEKIDFSELDNSAKLATTATSGLIAYRAGESQFAENQYIIAIEGFKKLQSPRSELLATTYYLSEESSIGNTHKLPVFYERMKELRSLESNPLILSSTNRTWEAIENALRA